MYEDESGVRELSNVWYFRKRIEGWNLPNYSVGKRKLNFSHKIPRTWEFSREKNGIRIKHLSALLRYQVLSSEKVKKIGTKMLDTVESSLSPQMFSYLAEKGHLLHVLMINTWMIELDIYGELENLCPVTWSEHEQLESRRVFLISWHHKWSKLWAYLLVFHLSGSVVSFKVGDRITCMCPVSSMYPKMVWKRAIYNIHWYD